MLSNWGRQKAPSPLRLTTRRGRRKPPPYTVTADARTREAFARVSAASEGSSCMPEPWDRPPMPKRGNRSERVLFEAVGRALMAWEEIETALAHLYAALATGDRFHPVSNREYGKPPTFIERLKGVEKKAARYFVKLPDQERESEFARIFALSTGFSGRRNDIAHGRVRLIHWIINPGSREALLSLAGTKAMQSCMIPAHFKGDKFTSENLPLYVYTSREINHIAAQFWPISRRVAELARLVEPPPPPSPGISTLLEGVQSKDRPRRGPLGRPLQRPSWHR